MSKASDMVRTEFKKGDDIRDAGLTTPSDIVRYDNIVYGEDAKWQSLDVYRPKGAEGTKLPVIVSVHGGGWVYGDKDRYQFYCMSLAQRGFAAVNFTYRLAPENKFPSSLEDTNRVFTWILEHSDKYGFDTEHIFGVGDSAGAHNLGLYAAICTNPRYAEEYAFRAPEGFAPAAIALHCGAYRIELGKESNTDELTQQLMEDLLPEKGTEKELELIDVTRHITENYPPTFFMTCPGDFLKIQAPLLAEKLAEKNIPFMYRMYGSAKNPLAHVFHCNIKSEDAGLCNDEVCDFFKKYI